MRENGETRRMRTSFVDERIDPERKNVPPEETLFDFVTRGGARCKIPCYIHIHIAAANNNKNIGGWRRKEDAGSRAQRLLGIEHRIRNCLLMN